MPRGDGFSHTQSAGLLQSPLVGKSAPVNSRLLPQGSRGFITGKTSVLMQGNGAPPTQPSSFALGVEPKSKSPKPITLAPSANPSPVKPQTAAENLYPADLHKKTVSLMEQYFGIQIIDEALQCVEELNSPSYHPQVAKEAIALALEKSPPCVEPVVKLLEFLLKKKVLTARDIGTGCLLYGSSLDDIGIDLPKALNNFGEVIGKLLLAWGPDFKVVGEVLKKVEDDRFRTAIFDAGMRCINSSPLGQGVLAMLGTDIQACESLLS